MTMAQHQTLLDRPARMAVSARPFASSICRRQGSPLQIVAAHKQQQGPAAGLMQASRQALLAVGSAAVVLSSAGMGHATEDVAEFTASGILFKDSVHVIAQEDPQVQGVTIYISDFKRSITDRLSKDFFDEPSQASVTCALTGKVAFDESAIGGKDGQEVFSERLTDVTFTSWSLQGASKPHLVLQNKTLRVRRVWDAAHKTLLYIAYSTHMSGGHHDDEAGRYKTSICALPLAGNAEAVAASIQ